MYIILVIKDDKSPKVLAVHLSTAINIFDAIPPLIQLLSSPEEKNFIIYPVLTFRPFPWAHLQPACPIGTTLGPFPLIVIPIKLD